MDGGGYIRELCLALEHHWEPELPFLLFTAYFDESDTHGVAPTVIIAAFLANARQWEMFGRKIRGLQRREGFTVFHAKDFRALRGEFEGWSTSKCARLVNDLAVAIRDNLTEGVTIALPRALYEAEYRSPPIQKVRLDTQYALCFRVCLRRAIQVVIADRKKHKIHIVIESGHKNVYDSCRVFDELKSEYAALGIDILGDVVVAKKSERMELMIADFQAHASHLSEKLRNVNLPGYFEMARALHGDNPPPRKEAALTQIEFTPESLRVERQAHIDRWRSARVAKRKARSRFSSASRGGQPS